MATSNMLIERCQSGIERDGRTTTKVGVLKANNNRLDVVDKLFSQEKSAGRPRFSGLSRPVSAPIGSIVARYIQFG